MSNNGEQISTSDDFKNVTIYRKTGPKGGSVYTLEFDNPEKIGVFRGIIFFVTILVLVLSISFFVILSDSLLIGFAIPIVLGFVAYFALVHPPKRVRRAIQIDTDADELRVLKKGGVVSKHKESRLHELSIGEHPDAERARSQRTQREPSTAEKQHTLYGWFGSGGAERVALLSRYEWPRHDSLYEVQQAMHWCRVYENKARNLIQPSEKEAEAPQEKDSGINPPLD